MPSCDACCADGTKDGHKIKEKQYKQEIAILKEKYDKELKERDREIARLRLLLNKNNIRF